MAFAACRSLEGYPICGGQGVAPRCIRGQLLLPRHVPTRAGCPLDAVVQAALCTVHLVQRRIWAGGNSRAHPYGLDGVHSMRGSQITNLAGIQTEISAWHRGLVASRMRPQRFVRAAPTEVVEPFSYELVRQRVLCSAVRSMFCRVVVDEGGLISAGARKAWG